VVDALGQLANDRRHVCELRLDAGKPVGQRLEPWVQPSQTADLAHGQRDPFPGAAFIVAGQCLGEGGAAARDRLAMLGGVEPGLDLVRLPRSQTRARDLVRLVLGQLEPAGQLAWVQLE